MKIKPNDIIPFLLVLLPVLSHLVTAQNAFPFGPLNRDKVDVNFSAQIIGLQEGGNTLWLTESRHNFFLEQCDAHGERKSSKEINFDSLFIYAEKKSMTADLLLYTKGHISLLVTLKDKSLLTTDQYILQLSETGVVQTGPMLINTIGKDAYSKFTVSPDSSQVIICWYEHAKEGTRANFKVINSFLQVTHEFQVTFPKQNTDIEELAIQAISMNNSGSLLVSGLQLNNSFKTSGYEYWLVKPAEYLIKKIELNMEEMRIETSTIGVGTTGNFELAGIGVAEGEEDKHNLFFVTINQDDGHVTLLTQTTETLQGFGDISDSEVYRHNFPSIITRKNNGPILIVEKFSWYGLWKFLGEIYVADFNIKGHLNYIKRIEKSQGYLSGKYFSAYSFLPIYDSYTHELHLIYNENPKNFGNQNSPYLSLLHARRGVPVMVTIGPDGKAIKRRLSIGNQNQTALSVQHSHVFSDNEIVMLGIQKKGYRIGFLKTTTVSGNEVDLYHPVIPPRNYSHHNTTSHIQTPQRPKAATDFSIVGISGGVSTLSDGKLSRWLDKNGVGQPRINYYQEVDLTVVVAVGKEIRGFDMYCAGNDDYVRWGMGYTFGRLLPSYPKLPKALCLALGFNVTNIRYVNTVLPQMSPDLRNFDLNSVDILINPSFRTYKPLFSGEKRSGLTTGMEIGLRLHVLEGRWIYNDDVPNSPYSRNTNNVRNIRVPGVPHISPFEFYITIPLLAKMIR